MKINSENNNTSCIHHWIVNGLLGLCKNCNQTIVFNQQDMLTDLEIQEEQRINELEGRIEWLENLSN